MIAKRLFPLLLCATGSVFAADKAPIPATTSLFQALLGLVVVLGILAALAWGIKRTGLAKNTAPSTVKVIGGVSIGNRERILVVEVADQWIVVGVAPGRVNTLSTMPRQIQDMNPEQESAGKNFATWLKQTIEKRNVQ